MSLSRWDDRLLLWHSHLKHLDLRPGRAALTEETSLPAFDSANRNIATRYYILALNAMTCGLAVSDARSTHRPRHPHHVAGGKYERDAAVAQRPDAIPREQARPRIEVVRGPAGERAIGIVHQGTGRQDALLAAARQEAGAVSRRTRNTFESVQPGSHVVSPPASNPR